MFRIHLLDGTYELFRAFHGAPSRLTSSGEEVGATIGFVQSVLGLLHGGEVTHLACAFDHVIESFRNDLFPGYKTGAGMDPLILAQFGLVEEAARAMGVPYWPMIQFEADDALASAAAQWSTDPRVSQILICTPDKDLAQCVSDQRVVCFDRRSRTMIDAQGVRDKYGVDPASIPDWLALVGDSADGIPGITGWGKKSAATVLGHYKHLEGIPRRADEWVIPVRGARKLARNLAEGWNQVQLYRQLATLRLDVDLEFGVDDVKWAGVPRRIFQQLCDRLEQPGLTERVPRWATTRREA